VTRQTATAIEINEQEQIVLEHIGRQASNPQWLVTRSKIILKAANGQSNRRIAAELGLTRNTVRQWRARWQATVTQRSVEGAARADQPTLRERIEASLSDAERSGAPVKYTAEQVVQLVAISCEDVAASGYPVSHWTPKAVAAEAVKRGIVSAISPRQVGRFLK
jgi:putative transposase